MSVADTSVVRAGYDAFGAEKVILVHNHPSENMMASPQDRALLNTPEEMFPADIEVSGIIIGTTSGNYLEFRGARNYAFADKVRERPVKSEGAEKTGEGEFRRGVSSSVPHF